MAAAAPAIGGGGAVSSFETTVLLTVDETMDACARQSRSSTERLARSGPEEVAAGWDSVRTTRASPYTGAVTRRG